ncbi:MAG: hypothetical protein LBL06_02175 [Treponema sp.]|jgi:capsule polysaccharide export protein KpsE/RkpR|nr:hypothetical protein [Treponema sp.]
MTFAERMKELAVKAGEVAQDFAEKAGDTAQDLGAKGAAAGKEFIGKAGDAAQNFGSKSKLFLEIKQLETKAEKLLEQLGAEVYKALAEQKIASVNPLTPGVKEIFAKLDAVQKEINVKEEEMGR